MKKIFYRNGACLFFFILTSFATKAQNILGSHITYTAIDSVTYTVKVVIYTDCSVSSAMPINEFLETSGGTQSFTTQLNFVSSSDVTGINSSCSTKSACAGGSYAYGVTQHIYMDTVSILAISSCNITFAWQGNIRSSKFTTGAASIAHYNYATLDRCLAGGNNSAVPNLNLSTVISLGQDFLEFYGSPDVDGMDSLSWNLAPNMQNKTTSINLTGNWTYQRPITFLSFPNAGSPLPAGFHLDAVSGDLGFRPAGSNQVASYCVEVKEWRNIGGTRKQVGLIRYDMAWQVFSSTGNSIPLIVGTPGFSTAYTCPGQQACINLMTYDANSSDSVTLTWDNGIPGAIFSSNNGSVKNPNATICWTPDSSYIRSNPYTFIVTAKDNSCPIGGISRRTFYIYVRPVPDTSNFEIESKTVKCNTTFLKVKRKKPIIGGLYFVWKNNDREVQTGDSVKLAFQGAGWQKFTLTAMGSPCTYTITDSVFISPPYVLSSVTKPDTASCLNDTVTLYTYPVNGAGPYTYKWSPSGTDSTLYTVPHWPGAKYYSRIEDANNCVNFDSVVVTVHDLPILDHHPDTAVCPQMPFTLSASVLYATAPLKFNWVGVDTLPVVTTSTLVDKKYKLNVSDRYGCKTSDSVNVSAHKVSLQLSPDTLICYGLSTQLSVKSSVGLAPFHYQWVGLADTTDKLVVSPASDSLFIMAFTESHGCTFYDSVFVKIDKPTLTAQADTGACKGSPVTLNIVSYSGTAPVSFYWNGVAGSSNYATTADVNKTISVSVSDKYNCKAFDSVAVTAFPIPVANAGADATVCAGTSFAFMASSGTGTAPYVYTWSNGKNTDTFSQNITAKTTLSVKSTDAHGCYDYDTVEVDIFPADTLQKNHLPALCQTASAQVLMASPSGGTWSGDGVSGGNFDPATAGPGPHILNYAYTNKYGCAAADTMAVQVDEPSVAGFVADKLSIEPNETVNFTNTSSPASFGRWNFGDTGASGNIVVALNTSYTYTNEGEYTVTLTTLAGNACPDDSLAKVKYIKVKKLNTSALQTVKNPVMVYPNPASGMVYISWNTAISAISLSDITGKTILENKDINTLQAQLNISALSPGVYIISVCSNTGVAGYSRIIIQ